MVCVLPKEIINLHLEVILLCSDLLNDIFSFALLKLNKQKWLECTKLSCSDLCSHPLNLLHSTNTNHYVFVFWLTEHKLKNKKFILFSNILQSNSEK